MSTTALVKIRYWCAWAWLLWSLLPCLCAKNVRNPNITYNTTLTQSITRALNDILLNQDKNFRPINADARVPLQVEVDISVRSMGPISEHDMEFSLDCYFRQKWLDRRLAFNNPLGAKQNLPIASKMLKDIWTPDTYIRNGRHSYLHTITVPNVLLRVRSDGQVHVSQRLTIRTRCKMFFKKFPMDSQACPIEIGSLGYYSKDVVYVWKDVDLDSKMGNMLSQYQLLDVIKTSYNVSDPRNQLNCSVLKVYFKLQRQQGFYILQIYTPCTLIVVMSWVSFWINKEASPARVALGIMTVLSMSTIGFGSRSDLPRVSHSTALDIYIISCFGFVFAAVVEYAIINYAHIVYIRKKVHDLKGLETTAAMEKMRMFSASLMGAAAGKGGDMQKPGFGCSQRPPWYRRIFARKQQTSVFYRMAVKAAEAKRKLGMSDPARVVNRIDSVSKVAFPSLYVLFNLAYWLAFLYWIPDEINSFI